MLKTKIFAAGIENLSDARYFAAWGASYMSYPAINISQLPKIKEMADWVEGPVPVVEVVGLDIDESLSSALTEIGMKQLLLPPYYEGNLPADFSFIYQSLGVSKSTSLGDVLVLKYEESFSQLDEATKQEISELATQTDLYIDIPFVASDVPAMLEQLANVGLVLRGSEEEKVGVKSFEDLDEILEQLEDY